jgi:hypothetical protein
MKAIVVGLNESNGQLKKIKGYNILEALPAHTRRKNQLKYNAALIVHEKILCHTITRDINYIAVIISNFNLIGS